ncbi:MAG: hypothetical protein QF463_00240 [Vicinamibacterales bacterium]|nr:hypothetical protein [Vicinamibacterales bacterium]MDP6607481.1 hypothetical protein [Vicinamibacterales bacterium]
MPSRFRLAAVCGLAVCGLASPALAQSQADPPSDDGRGVRFFSGYRFHLNAAALLDDDERFNWNADYGGELDVVDYGRGRVHFVANVETILGEELQRFDPNQGNYTLAGSMTYRLGSTEVAGTFHHISRHLGDRPKNFPIDWNMVGVQLWQPADFDRWHLDLRGRAFYTAQRSFVDYDGELGGDARLRYALNDRLAILFGGALTYMPTDADIAGRSGVWGGAFETGLRVEGDAVAIEIFMGVERRIDADPLEREARTWAMTGFRLLSRD